MAEFYTEFPGIIRNKKRRRKKPKPHSSSNLLGATLKVAYEREMARSKFLDSKEWLSLNKRERKNVRKLFRNQRSLSTQFLEQVTDVTNNVRHPRHQRLHRGSPRSSSDYLEREMEARSDHHQILKQDMLNEVKEWSKVPLDILSCISLDAHSSIKRSKNRRKNSRKSHRRKRHSKSKTMMESKSTPTLNSRSRNGSRNGNKDVSLPSILSPPKEEKNRSESEVEEPPVKVTAVGETLDAAFTLPTSNDDQEQKNRRVRGEYRGDRIEEHNQDRGGDYPRRRRRRRNKKKTNNTLMSIPGSQLSNFQYNKNKEWNFPSGTKQPWNDTKLGGGGTGRKKEKRKHHGKERSRRKQHSMDHFQESFYVTKMNKPFQEGQQQKRKSRRRRKKSPLSIENDLGATSPITSPTMHSPPTLIGKNSTVGVYSIV